MLRESTRSMSLGCNWAADGRDNCLDGRPEVVDGKRDAPVVADSGAAAGCVAADCETARTVLHDRANLGQGFAALWARPIAAEPRVMDLAFDHPASDTAVTQLAERIS